MAFIFIGDFLYGSTVADMHEALALLQHCDQLLTKPPAYWQALLKKYLLDQPHVVVRARPSTAASAQLAAAEKARVAAQVAALGPARLQAIATQLTEALARNDIPVPLPMISAFPIPDASRIPMIPVVTVRYDQQAPQAQSAAQLALRAHLDAAAPSPVDCWLQFDRMCPLHSFLYITRHYIIGIE